MIAVKYAFDLKGKVLILFFPDDNLPRAFVNHILKGDFREFNI